MAKTIAELNRELTARKKQVAKLRSQRAVLAGRLSALDRQIAALTGGATPGPKRRRKTKKAAKKVVRRARKAGKKVAKKGPAKKAAAPARRPVGRAVRKPLSAYLVEALKKGGSPMRAAQLSDAVVKAGYVTQDKNFKQTVASTLGTDARFQRVSRGIYKLSGK